MADFPFSALIAGGSSLLGGLLNQASAGEARDAAQQNVDAQMLQQRMFANHGLRWRAEDAMRAYDSTGIHPLAMLGVQGPSYSPVSYSGSADTSMGDAIAGAGQGISRAMNATKTLDERDRTFVDASRSLQLRKGELELQLIASQIRRNSMVGPAMPSMANPSMIPGQGDTPGTSTTGLIRDSYIVDDPASKVRTVPELTYIKGPQGTYYPAPHKDTKELIEDDFWAQTGFMGRNVLLPTFGSNRNPPEPPSPGFKWVFDPVNGYYQVRLTPGDAWHSRSRHPSERR